MTIQEKLWDLLTTGNVEQTHTKESVISLLQEQLCTEDQAKKLVNGTQKTLKKNLNASQLETFKMAFQAAGLDVFTRPSVEIKLDVDINSLALVDESEAEKTPTLTLTEDAPEPEIKTETAAVATPLPEAESVTPYSETRQMVCPRCKKIQPTSKECIYCSCYVDTFFQKLPVKEKPKKTGLVDKIAFWKK